MIIFSVTYLAAVSCATSIVILPHAYVILVDFGY